MIIITDLSGKSLPLIKVDKINRTRNINGTHELKLTVKRTEKNKQAFDLIEHEALVTLANNRYRIKSLEKRTVLNLVELEVTALHEFYDCVDVYQYNVISDVRMLSLHEALTHALEETDYTFSIRDDFDTLQFENFGNDNAIKLFNYVKERFNFEFTIENKHLTIHKQIGKQKNLQLRWKHNIKTIKQFDNTNNLSTYIKGFGKQKVDEEGAVIEDEYVVTAEYTSPNAKKYGIRHAQPIKDDRFEHKDALLQYIAESLVDYPQMEFQIEYEQLAKNININLEELDLGDSVYLIHEIMDLSFSIRIVEIIDNPINKNVKPIFTLSTVAGNNLTNQAMQYIDKQKQENEINRIKGKQTKAERAIERAAEDLNELEQVTIPAVNEELDRINNEVIPSVDEAIKESHIPQQITPPNIDKTQSKLWWDTSVNPHRLMRYNEAAEKWQPLAPH